MLQGVLGRAASRELVRTPAPHGEGADAAPAPVPLSTSGAEASAGVGSGAIWEWATVLILPRPVKEEMAIAWLCCLANVYFPFLARARILSFVSFPPCHTCPAVRPSAVQGCQDGRTLPEHSKTMWPVAEDTVRSPDVSAWKSALYDGLR